MTRTQLLTDHADIYRVEKERENKMSDNSKPEKLIDSFSKAHEADCLTGLTFDHAVAATFNSKVFEWIDSHGYRLRDVGGAYELCKK